MNQPIFLTKSAFNYLLANLVELEEGISEIIDVFFREPSKEADELKRVLNDYVRWLDGTLKRVTIKATADNNFPNAVIGSEVVVAESGGSGTDCYKLVSPLRNKIGSNEISFLSPMGKAMLLKKVNDRFVVEAPGGTFDYQILAIKIIADSQEPGIDSINGKGKSLNMLNMRI